MGGGSNQVRHGAVGLAKHFFRILSVALERAAELGLHVAVFDAPEIGVYRAAPAELVEAESPCFHFGAEVGRRALHDDGRKGSGKGEEHAVSLFAQARREQDEQDGRRVVGVSARAVVQPDPHRGAGGRAEHGFLRRKGAPARAEEKAAHRADEQQAERQKRRRHDRRPYVARIDVRAEQQDVRRQCSEHEQHRLRARLFAQPPVYEKRAAEQDALHGKDEEGEAARQERDAAREDIQPRRKERVHAAHERPQEERERKGFEPAHRKVHQEHAAE